jgi:polar amino acid transport system substrate-binding protein
LGTVRTFYHKCLIIISISVSMNPSRAWAATGEATQPTGIIAAVGIGLVALAAAAVIVPRYRRQIAILGHKLEEALSRLLEKEQALKELSTTDPVTGVNNRRRVDEFLDEQLDRARRYQRPFSIIMVDIDGFRQINDSLGHHNGDKILLSFAAVLDNRSRTSDLVGRWAGEEFLIICPETGMEGALSKVDNLRGVIANCVFGVDSRITASYGITQFEPEDTIRTMIHRAENALSQAKAQGKDQVATLSGSGSTQG